MKPFVFFMAAAFSLCSCRNKTENIYYDYKVSAEEERGEVTVMLQYRVEDDEGPAIMLETPGSVSIDGKELKPDSANMTGVFYELIKPVDEFKGTHDIVVVDSDKEEHTERFTFEPFILSEEFPEQVNKSPFTIKLEGISSTSIRIRLVITDTSYTTFDVNEEVIVQQGELAITEEHLQNLAAGPVTLELYREEEKPIKKGSKEGGRILMSYSLRRQFELVD